MAALILRTGAVMTSGLPLYGQEYARLPEDLLADLLRSAPRIAYQVRTLLGPALELRTELRDAAVQMDRIATADLRVPVTSCAVDGGFAVERAVAVDILLAVAVGVEGFAPFGQECAWDRNQYTSNYFVLTHDVDNERLARATMIAQELDVLADAPHEFRIYDGSHLTPVIQLNSGFSSRSSAVNGLTAAVATERDLPSTLLSFATDESIVAMPKYDSSRALCDELSTAVGRHVPGDDKYLAGLILRGGEHTTPIQVAKDPWRELHVRANPDAENSVQELSDLCNEQIESLRQRQLFSTYFRPDTTSPAYRIEVKPALAHDPVALPTLLGTLAAQMTGPFVREPYPQYLADVMAKSVSYGLSALQTAAQLALSRENPELAQLIVHSYRTEGK